MDRSTTPTDALHGDGLTDVRMMIVVHRIFRRELGLAVPGVQNTRPGDVARAGLLATHLRLMLDGLHGHHTHEDDMLWGALEERVPEALEPLVELMEEQHAEVARLVVELEPQVTAWGASASAPDRDRLAATLDALVTAMCVHLDAEERDVLPLMARHLTQEEWDAFAKAGGDATPKRLMLMSLGAMLYEADPDAIAPEMAKVPAPLRRVVPWLARRSYARYARRVHGTPTPTPGLQLRPAA